MFKRCLSLLLACVLCLTMALPALAETPYALTLTVSLEKEGVETLRASTSSGMADAIAALLEKGKLTLTWDGENLAAVLSLDDQFFTDLMCSLQHGEEETSVLLTSSLLPDDFLRITADADDKTVPDADPELAMQALSDLAVALQDMIEEGDMETGAFTLPFLPDRTFSRRAAFRVPGTRAAPALYDWAARYDLLSALPSDMLNAAAWPEISGFLYDSDANEDQVYLLRVAFGDSASGDACLSLSEDSVEFALFPTPQTAAAPSDGETADAGEAPDTLTVVSDGFAALGRDDCENALFLRTDWSDGLSASALYLEDGVQQFALKLISETLNDDGYYTLALSTPSMALGGSLTLREDGRLTGSMQLSAGEDAASPYLTLRLNGMLAPSTQLPQADLTGRTMWTEENAQGLAYRLLEAAPALLVRACVLLPDEMTDLLCARAGMSFAPMRDLFQNQPAADDGSDATVQPEETAAPGEEEPARHEGSSVPGEGEPVPGGFFGVSTDAATAAPSDTAVDTPTRKPSGFFD